MCHDEQKGVIIFIASVFGGGVSKITVTLHNELSKHIDVKLVQISRKEGDSFTTGSSDILLPNSKKLSYIHMWYKLPLVLVRLVRLCYNDNIKVIIAMTPLTGVISIISSLFHKHKTIVSIHAMPSAPESLIDGLLRDILYLLIRITKSPVVAVSEGVKDELVSICHINREQITVIYNPIDLETIRRMAEEDVDLPEAVKDTYLPLLITVGRLVDVKGHHHLIRIFAELQKTNPSYLMIIGTGPNEPYLKDLVDKYNLNESVFFMGWQENPYPYMAQSSLLTLTSLSEALPTVLIESMIIGCPILSTNCSPGVREIMGSDNQCGIVSGMLSGARHNIEDSLEDGELAFLKNLKKILNNRDLREQISAASKKRAKLFDSEIGIQKYIELIDTVTRD